MLGIDNKEYLHNVEYTIANVRYLIHLIYQISLMYPLSVEALAFGAGDDDFDGDDQDADDNLSRRFQKKGKTRGLINTSMTCYDFSRRLFWFEKALKSDSILIIWHTCTHML